MTCKDIDNLLPAYEEDLLPAEEKKGVETHLAACERCRRSLADLGRAQELVRRLGEVEPPPFFEERIMSRVRQEARDKRGLLQRLFYPFYIKIPIQALATVLVAVLAFHLYQQGDQEMKRVEPLPVPVAESAREPVAVEPPGTTERPGAVIPARPPAVDLPGASGQRSPVTPSERGGKRGEMADKAAVREERQAVAIMEERKTPETPTPERMAKAAGPGAAPADMAGEGIERRVEGRADAPGRAALRQEADGAPASPAPERTAKAKMADTGIAAGEGRPMPSASASGRSAASAAIGRSTVELTIQVADVYLAVQEIEKRLGEANARIIERRHIGEGEFLRAEMAAGRVPPLLGQLAAIGRVNVEKGQYALPEGTATVGITIESRP
jgi:hypothetical protein